MHFILYIGYGNLKVNPYSSLSNIQNILPHVGPSRPTVLQCHLPVRAQPSELGYDRYQNFHLQSGL